jgi:hypothetical protein
MPHWEPFAAATFARMYSILKQQTAWALADRSQLEILVQELTTYINAIEDLPRGAKEQQRQLRIGEITDLKLLPLLRRIGGVDAVLDKLLQN